jgi:LysM repeat protein
LAAEKQRRLCLTADHPTCATFEAARAARPLAHDRSPMLPRPLARTTPVVLDHGRLAIGLPAIRSNRTTGQALLVGLLAIAVAAIVLARLAGGAPGGAVDGSPTPGTTPGTSAGPTSAAPTSRLTASPGPSATAGATQGGGVSASPTSPSPSTSATRTYKVKAGDTLIGIAATFGTTPKALAALNGITDPSSLRIGQVLKIP